MKNMRQWNFVVAGLFGAFGAFVMYESSKLTIAIGESDPGSGFWPFFLGLGLMVLSIALVVMSVVQKEKMTAKTINLSTIAHKRVYIMMGFGVLYCILINLAGFYLSSLIFIPATMLLLGNKNKKQIFLVTVISVVAVYVVFGLLLKTQLPEPIFLR